MKKLFLIFLLVLTQNIFAASISIIGACSEIPLKTIHFKSAPGDSVGSVTIEQLRKTNTPFIGSERGIHSIFATPIGINAMEFLTPTDYMAYGWCYSVDGLEPGSYPDEYFIKNHQQIVWWFSYAHFKEGDWISQCSPSYLRASPQFCD